MLRLPEFRFLQPKTLAEAASILADEENVRMVAGGTDLWPNMKRRHQKAQTVVSLMRLSELRGIRINCEGGPLRIGATTILADIETDSQVRHRCATWERSAATSVWTRAAPTTTRPRTGAARSITA